MLHGSLSSSLTGFYKYLFLPMWSGLFGWGTYQLLVHPETVTFNGVKGGVPPGAEWVFLASWLLGTCATLWIAIRLRWLRAYNGVLYAGHFGREEAIPMDRVVSASELWIRPLMIRLVYRRADRREHIVWFVPAFRWPSGAVDPKILASLQALGTPSSSSAA